MCLLAEAFREWGITGSDAERVIRQLEEARLIGKERTTLQALIRGALDYVRALSRAESVEGGVVIDPSTGLPVGFTGKITLREPNQQERDAGFRSADSLFAAGDRALAQAGATIWLVLDRLDVAFVDSDEVEGNALRVRLHQTLFAEYPTLRPYIEKLERRKSQQSVSTLSEIWERDADEAQKTVEQLVEVGFFERRQASGETVYWVPFLYRDALGLVQGSEGGGEPEEDEEGPLGEPLFEMPPLTSP